MGNIRLVVTGTVARLGEKNPNQRQITVRPGDDETGEFLKESNISKSRPHLITLCTSNGDVTLSMKDNHGIWGSHQSNATIGTFNAIYERLAEAADAEAAVECVIEPVKSSITL